MKWKITKKKVIVIFLALLCVAGMVLILKYHSNELRQAFAAKKFEQVQLTVTQTTTDIQALCGENAQEDIQEEDVTTTEEICNIKRYDGITYEKNIMAEEYRYVCEGQEMILYAYRDSLEAESYSWAEVSAEEQSPSSLFDFGVFKEYKVSEFRKVDDYYVPIDKPTTLFQFLNLEGAEGLYGCDIKFYIEDGRLTKVVASYIDHNEFAVERIYDFSYNDEVIEMPEAVS